MTRARVTALALVNWKGVFYERYLLDRHVTALEGANGAGKTTVMIAAYVVLLPDLSRLRFTTLGESSATGGDRGIWGRLGEAGRPSYAALDLELAGGERLVAGVRLTRAGEPTVEATPFVVTGLGAEARLQELLLLRRDDEDHVPELDELKDSARRLGGQIEVFRTAKEYFACLFERGVTPLRLASDEDRNKLNEMLRTSMTGGISRALTSELRSFLLKEETGLADTLSRMRANLEACRRTRAEVAESRHLEREISGVYDAGLAMFTAAVLAARETAEEAQRRLAADRSALADDERAHRELGEAAAELGARQATLSDRLAAARADVDRLTGERDRAGAARALAARLAELDAELTARAAAASQAKARQTAAAAERAARKLERERAQEAYDRAAYGLAHLQDGLDELHRRAHAHRHLRRRLDDARDALDRPELAVDDAAAALAEVAARRDALDAERARLDRDARGLEARRDDHARALEALAAIEAPAADAVPPGDADPHTRARAALARLAEDELLVGRIAELEREQVDARRLAERQHQARTRAATLGVVAGPGAAGDVQARLEAVERAVRDGEDEARRDEAAADDAQRRIAELRARRGGLEDRAARFAAAREIVRRLAAAEDEATVDDSGDLRDRLPALRDRLADEQVALAAHRQALAAQREELLREAASLEATGASIDPELLRLRDDLGGELLAGRFDDLDPDHAAWLEARLGPLTAAIIVEDPDAAAAALASRERELPTVWLVRAGAGLDVEPPAGAGDGRDVVVAEPFGVRVTRPSDRPVLGRRALDRRVGELRAEAGRRGRALDDVAERAHRVAAWRRDADALLASGDVLAAGDPAAELAAIADELAALTAAEQAGRSRARAGRQRAGDARGQLDELRRLLGEALLLEPPDHGARQGELASALFRAVTARAELARVAAPRRLLAERLDVLRAPPPGDAELAARAARAAAVDAELDRLFRAGDALGDVVAHRHAAGWDDADAALAEKAALAPALEAQLAAARRAVQASDEIVAGADLAWEAATAAWQEADAQRAAAAAHRDRVAAELAELGGAGSDDAVAAVDAALAAAGERRAAVEAEASGLVEQLTLCRERRDQAARRVAEATAAVAAAEARARPAEAAWSALRASASDAGVLHSVLASPAVRVPARLAVELAAEAKSKRELLVDRLARARGGDELATALRADAGSDPGAAYLAAWREVRDWLRRRVPAQVAEVDDPLLALERLRDHLDLLEARLARQEGDLRGASEDVARGIEVQLRRARGQIRRLNQHLDGVHFGSIQGIRVEMRRVDRMEQILRALRDGEAQELLFLPSLPIEEALDEIFRRYGGGRSGSQRLLDYREYLELIVEIQRQAADTWEVASPTRLSTGEAIGVGAALMMVVLTEWERDANLLRARRAAGSLRFLFLDEANRLSRDNLGVLFDLCRNLDLQLLIAAPEVARAEGNTTYRLVRQVTDDGREEVIVSGRRAVAEPAAVAEAAEE